MNQALEKNPTVNQSSAIPNNSSVKPAPKVEYKPFPHLIDAL
jgi:hypothetical protein